MGKLGAEEEVALPTVAGSTVQPGTFCLRVHDYFSSRMHLAESERRPRRRANSHDVVAGAAPSSAFVAAPPSALLP